MFSVFILFFLSDKSNRCAQRFGLRFVLALLLETLKKIEAKKVVTQTVDRDGEEVVVESLRLGNFHIALEPILARSCVGVSGPGILAVCFESTVTNGGRYAGNSRLCR